MFLNYIKSFIAKKIIINGLRDVMVTGSTEIIEKVGIIIDESYFKDRESLVNELIKNDVLESNIQILVYKDRIKRKEVFDYSVFSIKNLTWIGTFNKREVNDFIATKFDLLINYYDVEKVPLLLASHQSKANFKVGFSSIDRRLNHITITTNAENHIVFVEELFKYLIILNKF
jgi:hypothetical protein